MGQEHPVVTFNEESIIREYVGYALTKYGNITFAQLKLIGCLNSFTWRMTDCKYTYDHMLENRHSIEKQIRGFKSYLDIYEIALRLNNNGITHLRNEFLTDIPHLGGIILGMGKFNRFN